jgi:hypothetical protein
MVVVVQLVVVLLIGSFYILKYNMLHSTISIVLFTGECCTYKITHVQCYSTMTPTHIVHSKEHTWCSIAINHYYLLSILYNIIEIRCTI